MKGENFLGDIPDELPDDSCSGLPDAEIPQEFIDLFEKLANQIQVLQQRRQEVFDKYRFVLDPRDLLSVRLALLVKHGLGVLTTGRMEFELDWISILQANIEVGLNAALQQKKAKSLVIPGRGNHKVLDSNQPTVMDILAPLMEKTEESPDGT
jgi:hypothetical protein